MLVLKFPLIEKYVNDVTIFKCYVTLAWEYDCNFETYLKKENL
jgi:hypothetical protein